MLLQNPQPSYQAMSKIARSAISTPPVDASPNVYLRDERLEELRSALAHAKTILQTHAAMHTMSINPLKVIDGVDVENDGYELVRVQGLSVDQIGKIWSARDETQDFFCNATIDSLTFADKVIKLQINRHNVSITRSSSNDLLSTSAFIAWLSAHPIIAAALNVALEHNVVPIEILCARAGL